MDFSTYSFSEFLKWERKYKDKTTPMEYGIMLSNRKQRGGGKKRGNRK